MPGFTLAQLEALESALAQGAKSVQYGDKKVEYATIAEMKALRAQMRRELGLITGSQASFPTFSKGF